MTYRGRVRKIITLGEGIIGLQHRDPPSILDMYPTKQKVHSIQTKTIFQRSLHIRQTNGHCLTKCAIRRKDFQKLGQFIVIQSLSNGH